MGGGLFFSLCNISKTAAPIVATLSVISRTFLVHIVFENCSRVSDRLATNDVRMTSCSAIFDAKKGFAERPLMPTVLKMEKNNSNQNHVK